MIVWRPVLHATKHKTYDAQMNYIELPLNKNDEWNLKKTYIVTLQDSVWLALMMIWVGGSQD